MKKIEIRNAMAKEVMVKDVVYNRRMLTKLFWLAHPVYCAKLLIKSPVDDRTAIETLEGIISFDHFKVAYDEYSR